MAAPLNKGHFHFVLGREVALFSEVKGDGIHLRILNQVPCKQKERIKMGGALKITTSGTWGELE